MRFETNWRFFLGQDELIALLLLAGAASLLINYVAHDYAIRIYAFARDEDDRFGRCVNDRACFTRVK